MDFGIPLELLEEMNKEGPREYSISEDFDDVDISDEDVSQAIS